MLKAFSLLATMIAWNIYNSSDALQVDQSIIQISITDFAIAKAFDPKRTLATILSLS
jgi:hypothetical protein